MQILSLSPLYIILALMLLLAGIIGLFAWIGHKNTIKAAEKDWDYRVSENMQDLRLDKQGFVKAYVKTSTPRGLKYIAFILASLAILAIPVFALIELFLHYVWIFSGKSRVFEPPFLVWQYSAFFLFIAIMAGIVWFFVREYHRRNPGLMRDAMIEARGDFWPEKKVTIGPNPIHLNADDYGKEGFAALREIFETALGFDCHTDDNFAGSKHVCNIYKLDDARVFVHLQSEGKKFDKHTHPFFFPSKFARPDDKPRYGEIIILKRNAYLAYKTIYETSIADNKYPIDRKRKFYQIKLPYLGLYIYEAV